MRARCGNESYKMYETNTTGWISWVEYGIFKHDLVQILLWIDAVLAVVGNALVVAWRCRRPKETRCAPISLIVINLSVSSLLYGVHLFLFQITAIQCGEIDDKRVVVDACRVSEVLFALASLMNSQLIATSILLTFTSLVNCFASTRRKTIVVLGIEWTIAIAIACYVAVDSNGYITVPSPINATAVDWRQCSPLHFARKHDSVVENIAFGIATTTVVVTVLVYVTLAIKVFRLRARAGRGEVRFLSGFGVRLLAITTISTAQWFSYAIFHFADARSSTRPGDYSIDSERSVAKATVVSLFLQPLVATLSPLLYTPCNCFQKLGRRQRRRELADYCEDKNRLFSENFSQSLVTSGWGSDDEES